jgi:hypothetical protein
VAVRSKAQVSRLYYWWDRGFEFRPFSSVVSAVCCIGKSLYDELIPLSE